MSTRVMRYTVVRQNPETLEAVALLAGEPVPDWAKDMVQDDDLEAADSSSTGGGYSSQSKSDLEAEADKRGLDVEGSGANGNVTKDDLVAALEADDANGA